MIRKKILIPELTSCLCISMFTLKKFEAQSPIWNFSSNDSTETFEWNDDTKDDALTVF